MRCAGQALLLLGLFCVCSAQKLEGTARVVDGDTLWIGEVCVEKLCLLDACKALGMQPAMLGVTRCEF